MEDLILIIGLLIVPVAFIVSVGVGVISFFNRKRKKHFNILAKNYGLKMEEIPLKILFHIYPRLKGKINRFSVYITEMSSKRALYSTRDGKVAKFIKGRMYLFVNIYFQNNESLKSFDIIPNCISTRKVRIAHK